MPDTTKINLEDYRLELRARRLAHAAASRETLDLPSDMRGPIHDRIASAVYWAVLEERKQHAEDMAALRAMADIRLSLLNRIAPLIVVEQPPLDLSEDGEKG